MLLLIGYRRRILQLVKPAFLLGHVDLLGRTLVRTLAVLLQIWLELELSNGFIGDLFVRLRNDSVEKHVGELRVLGRSVLVLRMRIVAILLELLQKATVVGAVDQLLLRVRLGSLLHTK